MIRTGCAILASGHSSRFDRPKHLVSYGERTRVHHAAEEATRAFDSVIVVVGACACAVAAEVYDTNAGVVKDCGWREGIASSIHVAVMWARARSLDALVLAVCDQPKLDAAHFRSLVEAHQASGGVVASAYGGVRGVPAIFPASSFAVLDENQGARALLQSDGVMEIPWPEGAFEGDKEDVVAMLSFEPPHAAHH